MCHGRPARARAWPRRPWHASGCAAALTYELEALIGFEPMTCSFGRSRARPLRYRADNLPYNPGVTDGSRTR